MNILHRADQLRSMQTTLAVQLQFNKPLQNFEIWDLRSETWLTLIWLIWFDMVPLRLQVLLLVLLVLCCHFCATPSPQSFKISLIAEQSSTTAFTTIALAPCTHFVFGPWFFLWLVGHHDVSCQTNIVGPRFDSVTIILFKNVWLWSEGAHWKSKLLFYLRKDKMSLRSNEFLGHGPWAIAMALLPMTLAINSSKPFLPSAHSWLMSWIFGFRLGHMFGVQIWCLRMQQHCISLCFVTA